MSDSARLNGVYRALGVVDYQDAIDKAVYLEARLKLAEAVVEAARRAFNGEEWSIPALDDTIAAYDAAKGK